MVSELPSRYRVIRHVANGGMGGVYAAEDEVLGRTVAVKVLSPNLAEDAVNRQRFLREARAAARLSGHPNVVQVYDVGEYEDQPFMVMELMDGGALSTRLRGRRPSTQEAIAWLREAAAALDHGHTQGIVHRDVKPANLLLDDEDVVHVADFGIARVATDETLTSTGQVLGTAAYLSPEQVLGQPATWRSDIYALAVVAFELLTGSRPYRGGHIAAQARQHVEAEIPQATHFRADLPKAVDPVLARGLAKDPGARWPSAEAMVDALERALDDEPTGATVPLAAAPPRPPAEPPAPPPEQPGRRRGGLLAGLALAALLLAVGAVVALSGGGGDSQQAAKRPTATAKAKPKPKPKPKPKKTAPAPVATTPTQSTPTQTQTASRQSAAALEAAGHQKLLAGDPAGAIPLLQQAIKATGRTAGECRNPSGSCLTLAYALFDLGRAERLTGHPDVAIPILQQRLLIDNQRGAVQQELDLAKQQASGSGGGSSGGGAKKPGKAKGKHGHEGDQG
jgi:serine/threonine-protein kinase